MPEEQRQDAEEDEHEEERRRRRQEAGDGDRRADRAAERADAEEPAHRLALDGVGAVLARDLLADVVGPLAADGGGERAGDDGDHAEAEVRDVEREAVALEEERRRPVGERADRRGVRAEAEHSLAIEVDAEQALEVALDVGLLGDHLARGLRDPETEEREREARAARDEEGVAPALADLDEAADEVAERAADRRRGVEVRERAAALLGRGDVVDDRRSERRVARLADADEHSRDHEAERRRREPGRDTSPRSTR